jgi:succinate dehydrogenase / fumarate reductase iron-sulfur subunit
MRHFKDGDTIYIEPWRARAFPVIKDLIVDRSALDSIIQAGGYISVHTGGVPDGNTILISKRDADTAMDASECIGCGACVAACPNGSAMLFTAAKITHLAVLPQGKVEAQKRVCMMTEEMLQKGFGNCSNHYECQAVCPKGIKVSFIARLNREFIKALGEA